MGTYAAPPTTAPQGVAPAQNMTYAAPSMTHEAVGAAPQPVSSPPVTYAAPPSLSATDTAIEVGNATETVTKIVAGAAPPVVIATKLPNSPRASRSVNSE